MALIIKIEKRDVAPDMIHRWAELPPLVVGAMGLPGAGSDVLATAIKPVIHEAVLYRFTGDQEFYIEADSVQMFTGLIQQAEYSMRPTVHAALVKQLELRDRRRSTGERWFDAFTTAKWYELPALWLDIKRVLSVMRKEAPDA